MDTLDNTLLEDNETLGLKKIIVDYLHRWKLFLGVFLFSFIPAIIYLMVVPKTYEVMARIQLQSNENSSGGSFGLGEAAGLMKSFGLGGSGNSSISIDDEMTILSSNDLLRQVIDTLGLQVEYLKPGLYNYKMYNNTPLLLTFDAVTGTKVLDGIEFFVSVSENDQVEVEVKSKEDGMSSSFKFASLPAVIKLNQGEFVLKYADDAKTTTGAFDMEMIVKPISWVAEAMAKDILIEDISKNSNILELSCLDYERRRAVDILNTLVCLYNEQAMAIKNSEAEKSLAFINERLQNVTNELHQTEIAIEKYKIENKMTDIEYDVQFYVGQMQELQTKIIELEAEIQVVNMMNNYVKDPANKYNLVPLLFSAQDGEKASPISMYNQSLLERNQLLKSSKYESPLVTQIDERLDKLRESVFLSISNTQKALQQSIVELKSKENLLYGKMGKVPTMERNYVDYKRQQEIYQGVYLILLQKREELALSIGESKDRARIVDVAFVKQKTVAPRKLYAGLGMILLTLVLPVLWVESKKLIIELKKEYLKTK